jgi:hypothetical protein
LNSTIRNWTQTDADDQQKLKQVKNLEKVFLPWQEVLKIRTGDDGVSGWSFITTSLSADDSKVLVSSETLPIGVFSSDTGKLLKSAILSSFSKANRYPNVNSYVEFLHKDSLNQKQLWIFGSV